VGSTEYNKIPRCATNKFDLQLESTFKLRGIQNSTFVNGIKDLLN
jgi:hypothetical protein